MKGVFSILTILFSSLSFSQLGVSVMDPFQLDTLEFNKRNHSFSKTSITENSDTLHTLEIAASTDSYYQLNHNNKNNYSGNFGFDIVLKSNKWYNRTQVLFGYGSFSTYTQAQPLFLAKNIEFLKWKTFIKTRTAYHPNKYLSIQAGIDNHFFGEGYRSLIQGDQVAPNPFAELQVKFLNLEYGLSYQFLEEHDFLSASRKWKYLTSHYLSWNAFRNFNISLYECVIYQGTDGKYKRGYEIEYLNPFVFFRPQEYSLGSTDNVFMALNLSYHIQKHSLYFQLLLDEFDLTSIKNRTRWWANKYGVQLGVKGFITPTIKYRFEGNLVRPYTYSHITSGQNSGHMGLPIGDFLGSNFAELLANIEFHTTKIDYQAYSTFYLKGYDVDGYSWGGNIYNSYVNRPFEYGHYIGQGSTVRFIAIGAMATYSLPVVNWDLYVQVQSSYTWGDVNSRFSGMIAAGVRSNLFNKRRIF